jgi:hypothetical protein
MSNKHPFGSGSILRFFGDVLLFGSGVEGIA